MTINNSERNLIVNMWSAGASQREIIQMLPYPYDKAREILNFLIGDGTLTKEKKGKTADKVLELYKETQNPHEIAEKLGARIGTVNQILTNAKLNRKRPRHNYVKRKPTDISTLNEKTQTIVKELRAGKKQAQVAKEQNVSKQHVSTLYYKYVNKKNGSEESI